jgi:8-amino-7-oxononanoate synthase
MTLEHALAHRLAALREQGLHRELRQVGSPQNSHLTVDGQNLLNFSSNDYLGLANDPVLKTAASEAVARYGAGSGASRLICGSLAPHRDLEEILADFKACPAAVSFSSGYAAALGTICALLDKDDVIVLDKLVHACVVDAARLSGARLRIFRHNDLDDLEAILKWARARVSTRRAGDVTGSGDAACSPRILIVTESVFSMDGDQAPLRRLVELKEEYGAWLMVDEAHATGLYGANRRGLAEEAGVSDRIEIQMGTLGKAVGSSGGYIAGSRALADYLINRARTFIFSTAPVPAAAAAAAAGIRFVQSAAGKERCARLWQRVKETQGALAARLTSPPGAILPVRIGAEADAVKAATALRHQGIFIPAIRYPTVARGQARLRLTLTASHTAADIQILAAAFERTGLLKTE